jgi:predicted esterase
MVGAFLLSVAGCTPSGSAPACAGADCLSTAAASPAPPPEPQLYQPFAELEVPGHSPAVVALPYPSERQRPLLVAAHGAGDRAEQHCKMWHALTQGRAFILCPRGQRTDRRVAPEHAAYYYPDHFALEREVLAAMAALRQRYADALDATAAVWAGFSQGAIQGAGVILLHPELFPRAALVEGGNGFFNEWSPWAARRYQKRGGQRVLFACGSVWCVRTANRCAGYLEHAGVEARVVHAEGAGHSYGPTMREELAAVFAWLVADDPRWSED